MNETVHKTFEFEDLREKDNHAVYEVEANYTLITVDDWGADIDGNRGIVTTFVDDYDFQVYLDSENVTQKIKDTDYLLFEAIESEVFERSEYAERVDYV